MTFILKQKNFLVFRGAVKDGSDTKSVQENTEVTLLKHASASNKHVCEVKPNAPTVGHSTCLLHQRNNVRMHTL